MLLRILLDLEGVQVKAVCDIIEDRVARAQQWVQDAGQAKPAGYARGERDFVRLCETEDLDLVITATPVDWHVPVCAAAMKNGKHAATEVHATYLLDECWELVETAEKHRRQTTLLENYCYFFNNLMVLNMVRQGLLGDIRHCEAGYQHDVRNVRFDSQGELLWRAKDMLTHNGNLYPTHALGPCSQWMNINRGDRFDYLVSMSSKSTGMNRYIEEKFGPDHPSAKKIYTQGDINCTMIKTVNGNTLVQYYDAQLPRPFDMIYRVQGDKGIYMDNMGKIHVDGRSPYEQWESVDAYRDTYEHPLWKALADKAVKTGHGGSDYILMYRLARAFQTGAGPDIDVYDTAAWSAVSPLSELSVADRSKPIDIPDFTRGKWKAKKPLGIVTT